MSEATEATFGSKKMKPTDEQDEKGFSHSEDEEYEKGFSPEDEKRRKKQKKQKEEMQAPEDEKRRKKQKKQKEEMQAPEDEKRRKKQKKQKEEMQAEEVISLVFNPPSLATAVCFPGVEEQTPIQFQSTSKQQYINVVGKKLDNSGGDEELFAMEVNKVYTLQRWVKEDVGGMSRWVDLPKVWRPTEKYTKGVEAFLLAVSDFFSDNEYHGDLMKEGMIMVKELESAKVGNNYPREVIVTIQPSSLPAATPEEIQRLQEQDLDAVVGIVFGLILEKVEEGHWYQQDLLDLQSALTRPIAVEVEGGGEAQAVESPPSLRDRLKEAWKFGNHTGLWSSSRRRSFLHNVVDHIKTDRINQIDNPHCLTHIETALDYGLQYGNWEEKLNQVPEMLKVYESDQGRAVGKKGRRYDSSGSDFTRYCHNFLKHIREWSVEWKMRKKTRYRRMKRKYVGDASAWVTHDDYAELILSQLFPTYMMDIVASLKRMRPKIEIK